MVSKSEITVTASSANESERRCFTCRQFAKLLPGHAGVCMDQQQHREWNEAMALMSDDDVCEKYEVEIVTKKWTSTVSGIQPKRLASKRERAAAHGDINEQAQEYVAGKSAPIQLERSDDESRSKPMTSRRILLTQ